jgi:hypothetical protein
MRIAWLLGVFLFQPHPGWAASVGSPAQPAARSPAADDSKELALLIEAGELPPIALKPLPERPSPEPVAVKAEFAAYEPRIPRSVRTILLRRPRLARARQPEPAAGEGLRDAVASPPVLESFLAALRGPDARGRCAAIESFSTEGNFAAIPYVSAVLLRVDEALPVRVAAARALGRVGDRRAWGFLARAVSDREPAVRLASAIALGSVAGPGAVKPLARALQSEGDENVRAALAWALGSARSRRD